MADNEQKAMQLVADAEKKLKSAQGFLGGLFRSSSKIEEACEMYTRAANMFKMAKKWSAAGSAFSEAANLRLKMENQHDAAAALMDAGNCYKKSDPHEAIKCITKAIEFYTDMGRFTVAAKQHMTVAEIYETEMADIEKAMNHYEQAADYFRGEESNSSANKCMLSVAKYAAQLEQYEKAINIYEQVGETSLASPLMKYSAKEYYFCATLLHMCVDTLNAQVSKPKQRGPCPAVHKFLFTAKNPCPAVHKFLFTAKNRVAEMQAIKKYEELCPSFRDSREYSFVKTLVDKLEEQDVEGFTDAVKEYDSISRLDSWYTNILLRIKKGMQENPDLC